MRTVSTLRAGCPLILGVLLVMPGGYVPGHGAESGSSTNSAALLNWSMQEDHRIMMRQLGITRLRPGPSGEAGRTNSANYDAAKANPFPDLPDPLVLKNGGKVATAEIWWKQRRPEIVEDFEREVVGRVPKDVPGVTWTVVSNVTDGLVGKLPANGKRLVGHVDNAACAEISVEIRMSVVTPASANGRVPVLMMFGGFFGDGLPRPAGTAEPTNRPPEFGGPFKDPPYRRAKLPPVNMGLLEGELAWRQHDGGHEDRSNMKYFIEWAKRMTEKP